MWSCWNSEFRWFVGWRRVLLSFSLLVQRDRSFSSSELCCVTCHAFVWRVHASTWCVLRPKKTSEPLPDPPTGLRFPCKSSIQKKKKTEEIITHVCIPRIPRQTLLRHFHKQWGRTQRKPSKIHPIGKSRRRITKGPGATKYDWRDFFSRKMESQR